MAYLEVEGLGKTYAGAPVLCDVSFSLEKDQIACVVGPSGSGKTTLVSILAGMVVPDAGSVSLGGRDVLRQPPHRRGFGIVPQDFKLFPHLTVFDNVAFAMQLRRVPKERISERVSELLEQMNIAELKHRWPPELSGGQAQRVSIARALASEPEVLLLDEPLAHVEPSLRRQLEEELIDMQHRASIPFVMVTHSQEEALAIADVLIVLRKGRVAQAGLTRDVYLRPASAFVAGFLGGATVIPILDVDTTQGGGFQTPIGVLTSSCAIPSSPVHGLAVRASAIRMAPSASAGRNVVSGKVRRTLFRGLYTELSIEVIGLSEPLTVHVHDGSGPAEGTIVQIELDPAGLVAVGR